MSLPDSLSKQAAGNFHRKLGALLAVLTLLFGCWALTTPFGRSPRQVGGDAHEYHRLATNTRDHGSYSLATETPYGPSIARQPGYPLFLMAVYEVAGRSPVPVRILQVALHGLSAWLLFLIGLRLVGPRAAAISAVLCVTYLPLVQMTVFHLSETLGVFLVLLLVYQTVQFPENTSPPLSRAVGTGITAALLLLTRPALGVLFLIPLGTLCLRRSVPVRQRLVPTTVLLATMVAMVSPWFLYTYSVSGKPRLGLSGITIWNSALQYAGLFSYHGSNEDWALYGADYTRRMSAAAKRVDATSPVSPSIQIELMTDADWRAEAKRIFKGVSLPTYFRRTLEGAFWLWSPGTPFTEGWVPLLCQAQWLFLVTLIGLGAWFTRNEWRRYWIVWVILAYITVIHLIFHVEPRYSFPGRPIMLLLAGLTMARLLEWKLTHAQQKAVQATVASALLFLAATAPAHAAYVDPGSGALLLQAIGAGILGVLFFFRQSFARLFRWGRRSDPSHSSKPPAGDPPSAQ
jgi:4-amino-4-deoxy-L-arabinose transferase-like glycosyltransferase